MDRHFNNPFNESVYKKMAHDFSLMDIDGIVWKYNDTSQRLLIYEFKNQHETVKYRQRQILKLLNKLIDWKQLDEYSCIFVLRREAGEHFSIEDLDGHILTTLTFKELYLLFSGQELPKFKEIVSKLK